MKLFSPFLVLYTASLLTLVSSIERTNHVNQHKESLQLVTSDTVTIAVIMKKKMKKKMKTKKDKNKNKKKKKPTKKTTKKPIKKPTKKPMKKPTKKPTYSPMKPADPDVCNTEEKIYQLKMYWKKGTEWQESTEEKAWCAECADDCDSEENVLIRECDEDEKSQDWIFISCTIRPKRNPSVCFTAGETRSDSLKGRIELHPCKDDDKVQMFQTYDLSDASNKFQFKILKGSDDICLSQEHHPRDKEELRFVDCERAEENDSGVDDDTSHWVVGTFDGHR